VSERDVRLEVGFECAALLGDAEFRAYLRGRGYEGERIIVALDDEPAVEVLERVFRDAMPALLAVQNPNERWGFAFRTVDRWPGEHQVEVVEFAEGTSIGMLVAATGPHQFEVPRESEEPIRVLVA
jgi:hypothetical protein